MSEPHAEPQAADVRSFLPRPGEPVEDYAARLRALHEDLTLVLDAVERGLAAAEAEPDPLRPEPLEVVAEPRRSPPPLGPLSAPRGSARVEVISTPAGAAGAGPGGEQAWSGPPEPGGPSLRGRRAPMGEGAPVGGDPAAPSPERFAERRGEPWVEAPPRSPRGEPWVERSAGEPWAAAPQAGRDPFAVGGASSPPWREPPPWTERRPSAWPAPPRAPQEMSFEPPAHAPFAAPPRRRAPSLPPLAVAAALLGWLVAIALVIALAFGL